MGALLLTIGDRTCEECRGTGVAVEEQDDGRGNCWDIEVACEHCENGRVTERQNMRAIDMAFYNRLTAELIANDRFRTAAKRRGCWRRGQMACRFLLADSYLEEFGRFVAVGLYPNVLPGGPTILLR